MRNDGIVHFDVIINHLDELFFGSNVFKIKVIIFDGSEKAFDQIIRGSLYPLSQPLNL